MEIKTCEQYVLDQLEQARAERDWLREKLEQAQDEAEELRGKLMERGEHDASKVEQAIRKEGRRKLYRDGSGYRTSVEDGGKLIPFSDWCIEHVGYSSLRCGMTKSEFIAYFEPEFREEYDELATSGRRARNDTHLRALALPELRERLPPGHPARQDRRRGRGAFDRRVADRRQLPVFRQLLSEMDKLGYGLAWRILDAQFFGVAQRRRRLFLVGHLGACPPIGVLIEPESMRGNLESSAEKRASLAEEAGRSPRSAGFKYHQGAGAGGVGAEPEQSPTLTADWHNPAVYPIDEPITMADLNANTAIGYDMVGTLKVGGDAPSVCL